jgi:hypothetical protein
MFIQVIRGKVKDAGAMRAASEEWESKLKPGATGYLGATEGVADDGTFMAVVRFESEEAAKANSQRPEQGEWWDKTSKLFEGDVKFFDCPRVVTFDGGGSDEAGFVQFMVYKPADPEKVLSMASEFESMSDFRQDVMGGTSAVATDGTMIDTNYFTSEAEAREGEKKEMPAEMQKTMENFGEISGPVEFIDIREPWLFSK